MDETLWLQSTDPGFMLAYLQGKGSDRKMRLFAVACCRALWPVIKSPRVRAAIEGMERYVEGWNGDELAAARQALRVGDLEFARLAVIADDHFHAAGRVSREALVYAGWCAGSGVVLDESGRDHAEHQCDLLREIFGNPFRPMPAAPLWRTPDVIGLASVIYREQAFDRLPFLGDALEEAGADPAVLEHCRAAGVHVRGCWLVDLVLGRS